MKIDVLTLFPKMFGTVFEESIVKRAINNNKIEIEYHDLRKWAWNSYGAIDDRPYGGGAGMLIRVDVIDKAIKDIRKKKNNKTKIVLTSAKGKKYGQENAKGWASYDNLIIICGHYEGFDARVSSLVDEEISIGDYVLTGGEIPAMVIIDSVVRLIPGVLGNIESPIEESHSTKGYIEYPQYTRPKLYNGIEVPEILLSGNPVKIKEWQLNQSKTGNNNSK